MVLDRRFVKHSCVTLVSLLKNHPRQQFVVHCLYRDVPPSEWAGFEEALGSWGRCELRRIEVEQEYPSPHFYKLALADLVCAERVLYLDSDVVVTSSLQQLWDCDLEENFLAAVEDVGTIDPPPMTPGAGYFNSGVMLLDLKRWRDDRLSQRVLEWTLSSDRSLEQLFFEQHGMNACVDGRWKRLPLTFNQQSMFFEESIAEEYLRKNPEQRAALEAAKKHPCIVHFTGATKPWQLGGRRPQGWRYWYYRLFTPYRWCWPENFGLVNLLGSMLPDQPLQLLRSLRSMLRQAGFDVERLYGPGGKDTERRLHETAARGKSC